MTQGLEQACFLINPKSGGGLGHRLELELRKKLPQAELIDLTTCQLAELLQEQVLKQQPLIVCGGDGSIASVIDCIYDNNLDLTPALIPLGTGNDLAKTLGWLGPLDASIDDILAQIQSAKAEPFDRMCIVGPSLKRTWYNYCSWGLDAEIAHHFDLMRKQHPWLFFSAKLNKLIYAYLGLRHFGPSMHDSALGLSHPLPHCRSLVCANINSYAGGMRLGSQVSHADGAFDVFGLPHSTQLLPVFMGRRTLRHHFQCQQLQIRLNCPTMMQCDGEAWLAAAGQYTIFNGGQLHLLRNAQARS